MRVFLLCWLLVAFLVGYSGVLRNTRLPMPALAMALTVTLLLALAIRRDYRDRALSFGVRALIALHLTRFVGIYFLSLYNDGLLPRDFAVPAGWGDIVVAVLAVIVLLAFSPQTKAGRTAILIWNIIGLVDILLVLSAGATMARADPLLQAGFTALPLSLLPTFLVPLIVVTHLLIFVWWARSAPPSSPAR